MFGVKVEVFLVVVMFLASLHYIVELYSLEGAALWLLHIS